MNELRVRPLTSDSCPAPLRPRHLRVQLAVQGSGSGSSVVRGLPRQMFEDSSRKRVIGSQFTVPTSVTPGNCGGCARLEVRLQQLLHKYKAVKHRYLQLRGEATERTQSEDDEQNDDDGNGNTGGSGKNDELIEALKRKCQAAETESKALQRELDALKRGYDELAEKQRETAAAFEAMTTRAESDRNELSAAKEKLQAQATAMRDLESSIARQKDAGTIAANSLQQSLQQARSEATQLREQNVQLTQELKWVQAQCERLQDSSAQLEAALSETRRAAQQTEAELKESRDRYKQQLENAVGEHRSAMQRIASLEERMTGLLQVISKHSKERQKIMDNAFTSAIRLCVIAPTVTVEVDDLSVRIGPTVNESQIRGVVVAELTERYNLIFKQESEDAGPNGEDLDSWVRRMTRRLKSQLEEQITSAVGA